MEAIKMRNTRSMIGILSLFLVMQIGAIFDMWSVKAIVRCDDLSKCSGDLYCFEMASHMGLCLLKCDDGIYLQCSARDIN